MTTSSKAAIDHAPAKFRNFHYRCATKENDVLPQPPLSARTIPFAATRKICARVAGRLSPVAIFSRDNFCGRNSDIFFLTIDLNVTLVQHHTLHCVHFFLDFVFH
jgi:hypothetical protein